MKLAQSAGGAGVCLRLLPLRYSLALHSLLLLPTI